MKEVVKRKIGIVVDSTTKEAFKASMFQDASVVPLTVFIDKESYVDGTITNDEILKAISAEKKVTTSQPSPESFLAAYKEQFALGYDAVLCLTISLGLSGTVNSAHLAKKDLLDENPELGAKVFVIDSQTAGPGVELLLEKVYKMVQSGLTVEEVVKETERTLDDIFVMFSIESLKALVAGGRLSKLQAMIGNILKVKPILKFKASVLVVAAKVRGSEKIYTYLAEQVKAVYDESPSAAVNIVYIDNPSLADKLKGEILQLVPNANVIISGPISPVIAVHMGYDALGMAVIR